MRGLASPSDQKPRLHRGLYVTPPLQTVLDIGRWDSLSDAVTATDLCLNTGLFTFPQLEAHALLLKGFKGVSRLKNLMLLAQGASECPRESALRVAMWENGFPPPDLQVSIVNRAGQFLGRVDALFWETSVLVEYDGEGKYKESTEKALLEERRREKNLLNLGTRMIRVTSETFADGRWIQDLRRELELGRGRPLDRKLWSSKGLGWGSPEDKRPRGLAYPR